MCCKVKQDATAVVQAAGGGALSGNVFKVLKSRFGDEFDVKLG